MPSTTVPDPADDAAALGAVLLARAVDAIGLPGPALGDWRSPAATEYAAAVARLQRTLRSAADAFRSAGVAA